MLRIEMKDVAVRKVLQRRCVSANPIDFPPFSTTFFFLLLLPLTNGSTISLNVGTPQKKKKRRPRRVACGRKQQYLCVYALTVVILNVLIR
jgi:hypothetical protein